MAVDRNVTWKEYNGTDYDNLYPTTKDSNVLLSTESKEKLGITGDGATIANAFTGIVNNGAGFAVGDTLTTRRQNLGDKWLLCNGATVQAEQYPELSQLFQDVDLTKSGTFTSVDVGSFGSGLTNVKNQRYKKVGDYWIVFGNSYTGPYAYAWYSDTPTVASSWKALTISVGSLTYTVFDMCYYQGKYVAVANRLQIYYSDTIDGEYTAVASGVTDGYGFTFVETDGTRVFASRHWSNAGTYGSLVVWTSDLFGSATFKQASGYGLRRSGNKIYWEPSGYQSTTTGLRVYNESTDSWVNATVNISGRQIVNSTGPVYVNGKYYASLSTRAGASGNPEYGIFSSDDGVAFNSVGGGGVQRIYCAIDNVLVTANGVLYEINNNGSLSNIGTLGVSSSGFVNFNGMNSSDIAFVCTRSDSSTTTNYIVAASYVNTTNFVLPSISLNKTYTYIKAKT